MFLNVGLCLSVYNLNHMGTSYVMPGDSSSHTTTTFDAVFFNPFVGEIIEGEVLNQNSQEIQGEN